MTLNSLITRLIILIGYLLVALVFYIVMRLFFSKSSSLLIAGCHFGMSFAYPSTDVVV